MLIFVIRKNGIFISMIRDPLFFLFVNVLETPPPPPPCTTLTEQSKISQYNSMCWFIRHIVTVFLFNHCLSSYWTVSYLKNDSLLRILRFPGYLETPICRFFFHFPWNFEIAGFNCRSVCLMWLCLCWQFVTVMRKKKNHPFCPVCGVYWSMWWMSSDTFVTERLLRTVICRNAHSCN